tara:strand:- start:31851 stop:33005 length:1155 start_codon:yes stop_codon:yes gene_type:complete
MTEHPLKPPVTVTHIISGDLWAGAEVQVYNLCKALNRSEEVAVTAVVFNRGILHDRLVDLGIPVGLADENEVGPLGIARNIAAHCRLQETDIVHTHGFKENVLGIFGKELAGVRYSVRTVHGNPEHQLSWRKPHKWLIHRLDIWLGRTRQQAVIAVSSQLEKVLGPIFPGRVRKIFNFIDVQELRSIWLPKPDKQLKQIRLGIVGRLVPVKRIDIFLKTIQLLAEEGINCKGIVLGDGPLRDNLKELARTLGVEQRIEFRGFVNPAAKEMVTLDALLMTSDHEGLPMVLLEALALEIPCIGHRTGGIPEIFNGGKCGYLVNTQNETDYAQAVKILLKDKQNLNQARLGIEHIESNFSIQSNAPLYSDIYSCISGLPEKTDQGAL